ncbi:MAG: RNA polymerase sigma factor [Acidimicrobiia bacterium]
MTGGLLEDDAYFASVLAGVRAGEPWAAEVLFEQLHVRLLRFFRAREVRAAEDLVGEVWEHVAAGLEDFEGDWRGFRAWVFLIARRRAIDHTRRAVRCRTDPHDDVAFDGLEAVDQPEAEVAERDATSRAVAMVSRLLPEDQAEVVLLRVLGDLEVAEVAAVMGRTENWVRVTQHRALRRLADRLGSRKV